MTRYRHLPPGIGYYPTAGNGVFGTYFFHLLPFLEQGNLYAPLAGQCAVSAAGRTDRGVLSGQQQRLQPAGADLPLPFGSERRVGRRRDDRWGFVRRVLLRAQCPGVGAERPHHKPAHDQSAGQEPASPTISRTALRTPFSMPRNMPAARTRPWRRRSRTAARRGRTARPPCSPGSRRP